jgi:hypothetical protein
MVELREQLKAVELQTEKQSGEVLELRSIRFVGNLAFFLGQNP